MKFSSLILLMSIVAVWYSCSPTKKMAPSLSEQVKTYRSLLEKGDYESALSMMVKNSRRWWGSKSGEGNPWIIEPGYSGPWSVWDDHFQTVQKIVEWKEKENAVTLVARETNDYFRLLERGWVTNEITYYFNESGQIYGLLIRAIGERPPGRTEEFLEWARKNDPGELSILMPDGEIDPSGDHPQRFRRLLNRWRIASGLDPINASACACR